MYMIQAIRFRQSSETISLHIIRFLNQAGLQVLQSFNLNDIKSLDSTYQCPIHQDVACDCEYKVLLVYRNNMSAPTTLLISGHSESCAVQVLDNVQNHILAEEIIQILQTFMTTPPLQHM